MAKLINGNGNLAIYAEEDADWYASIFGNQTSITGIGNQFAYSLLDANTIGVEDGVIITKEGRRIQLNANEIDEFEIPNGSQGTTNYYIIGYRLITDETSAQTCETFVELMDNGTDTIPEGSFREGDDSVDVSLYRVKQEDLTITAVTLLLPKVGAMSAMANDIATLNTNLTEIIGMQSGAGTKTVSLPSGKNKILCITKKSGVVVVSKEIPVAVLNTNDVILLGQTAPIIATEVENASVTQDTVFTEGKPIGLGRKNSVLTPFVNETAGAFQQMYNDSYGIGLASDLSKTIGASITYNGNNSFTITSVAGFDVYLIA